MAEPEPVTETITNIPQEPQKQLLSILMRGHPLPQRPVRIECWRYEDTRAFIQPSKSQINASRMRLRKPQLPQKQPHSVFCLRHRQISFGPFPIYEQSTQTEKEEEE